MLETLLGIIFLHFIVNALICRMLDFDIEDPARNNGADLMLMLLFGWIVLLIVSIGFFIERISNLKRKEKPFIRKYSKMKQFTLENFAFVITLILLIPLGLISFFSKNTVQRYIDWIQKYAIYRKDYINIKRFEKKLLNGIKITKVDKTAFSTEIYFEEYKVSMRMFDYIRVCFQNENSNSVIFYDYSIINKYERKRFNRIYRLINRHIDDMYRRDNRQE